ncbi:hypothetical protein Tco_0811000 [Tanacetum coccineum]
MKRMNEIELQKQESMMNAETRLNVNLDFTKQQGKSNSLGKDTDVEGSDYDIAIAKSSHVKHKTRAELENLKGKSVETKFDKPSILRKSPADKLLTNSKISKSWFVNKVVMQKDLSKPVTAQTLPKSEKDKLFKRIASLESKLAS